MRGLLAVAAAALAVAAPAADLVPSLPGWTGALPSAWYSGYLNAGPGLHYHYTLIASENNPVTDPIIFWQNGGPGCSSMEGLFAELGQLHVAGAVPGTAPTSPPSLYYNPYSWSTNATVVFIETPACVGFSYADDIAGCTADDFSAAQQSLTALLDFFGTGKFPEYAGNDLYLAGESYAGIYTPMLAKAVVEYNNGNPAQKLSLKGIAVGNGAIGKGFMNPTLSDFSYPLELQIYLPLYYQHNLISPDLWAAIQAACPDANTTNPTVACEQAVQAAHAVIGPVDVYNMLLGCAIPGPGPQAFTRSPGAGAFPLVEGSSFGPIECTVDTPLVDYLTADDTKTALHVPLNLNWAVCASNSSFNYSKTEMDETITTYPVLINAGLRILIYSGDQDACLPTSHSLAWVNALQLNTTSAWHPYLDDSGSTVMGYATAYNTPGGFEFATVHGAGHMVPMYQAQKAKTMFSRWLAGTPL